MTQPDIPMPYGVSLVPVNGSTDLVIPESQQNLTANRLKIPQGVVQIVCAWSGAESIEVRFSPDGVVTQYPLTIPPGTNDVARRDMATIGVPGDAAYLYFRIYPAPSTTTLQKKLTAALSVIPTSPPE